MIEFETRKKNEGKGNHSQALFFSIFPIPTEEYELNLVRPNDETIL